MTTSVPPQELPGAELVPVDCTVNGRAVHLEVPPHRTLMDALRYQLGLTGTKTCCAEGECGACTVLVDGEAVNSCLMLAAEGEGHEILTIEGLGAEEPDGMNDLQHAFLAHGAVQCGFCIPGQVMAAEHLLRTDDAPDEETVREGMSGNLCRCAGYQRIVAAVLQTAESRRQR